MNWPKKASGPADELLPVCTIAPHVALRRPVPTEAVGGCGSRALADATHGRATASERDPHAPSFPEKGPQSWPDPDSWAPAEPARVPPDGQGLRPAARGSEVRARKGEPHSHPVPDLPEQDDRRTFRAPARRARFLPPPLAVSHLGGCKPSPGCVLGHSTCWRKLRPCVLAMLGFRTQMTDGHRP